VTDVLRVDPAHPDPALVAVAAACLRAGGLVAFPTETVYGLGAHALDEAAIVRLFDAKQRPADDPLIVHVADAAGAAPLAAQLPAAFAPLAARFWPGPLTLVLPRAPAVPRRVTAGLDSVAVRVPAHPVAQALLATAGLPVAAPSANLFSRPSPTTAAHVLEDLDGRIDMVLDGGATTVGLESTVLDLSVSPPRLLRPGAIGLEQLRPIVPDVVARERGATATAPAPSPGLLPRHYAPRAPLTLYTGEPGVALGRLRDDARAAAARGLRVGLLVPAEDAAQLAGVPAVVVTCGSAADPAGVAARIYAALRELDRAPIDVILARDAAGTEGLGPAIRDRLTRAADGRVVRC